MSTRVILSLHANNDKSLQIPYKVQQRMSSESQPVLGRAVPTFELFMTGWEKLGKSNKRIAPFIKVGLEWVELYYNRMDNMRAYIIAMCESLS